MIDKDEKIEELKKDLRLGKEYQVLALKYDMKVSYIKKIYSEMKKSGEDLQDRRNSEWRGIQFRLMKDMRPVVSVYSRESKKKNK